MLSIESSSLVPLKSKLDKEEMSMSQAISSVISIAVMSNMQNSSRSNFEFGFSERKEVLSE